jgi:hypothetical protein
MPPRKPKPPSLKVPTPKQPKPWDIRPKHTTGDGTADDVFRAVGMALTRWEFVEVALADIFTIFIGAPEISPPSEPAVRAYGSIPGFKSRVDMVDAAGEAFFHIDTRERDKKIIEGHAKQRAEFVELLKAIRGFADRRNDIAHGIVHARKSESYLGPPLYNAKKYPITPNRVTVYERATYRYGRHDIDYYRNEFEQLATKIENLCSRLRATAAYLRNRARKP